MSTRFSPLSMSDLLSNSVQYVKGVGPNLAKLLSKKGIATLEDALYFVPRAYEDRRRITPIRSLRMGETATVFATVQSFKSTGKYRRTRSEAVISDESGSLKLQWFHSFPGLKDEFQVGNKVLVYGEVRAFGANVLMVHPDYELVKETKDGRPVISSNFGRIVPIYSETEGLHQKTLRRLMRECLKVTLPTLEEVLPADLLARLDLPNIQKSFTSLHFPENIPVNQTVTKELKRIIFEEFFILQLGLELQKKDRQHLIAPVFEIKDSVLESFRKQLPFTLTKDQEKALSDIYSDLKKPKPMVRLIQGDVGSGKTAVAFAAALVAIKNGYQAALLAPTEILAQQHYKAAEKVLGPLGISVGLITHSERNVPREFTIGTHALFQEKVNFTKLGLVIVDEQHRFGVDQRNDLLNKSKNLTPHILMMTATPIPRSLALTCYGDLDLTLIREKPAGRIKIRTDIYRSKDRPRLYSKIRETVMRGEQVYIIYPLVEASEKLELKSAIEMHDHLKKEIFPQFKVGLVHGRLKADEKDQVLIDFKNKKYDMLVSTTVIEVGIDVPNATLMVVEHPERLGLSQLHQLRGRVGRSDLKSECILIAEEFVTERLRIMERTDDGFEIAEEDLRIRGPGEFLGTKQSGLPGFRVGHILRDQDLLQLAKNEAQNLLKEDPLLEQPQNKGIRRMLESRWKEKIDRLRNG